MRTRTTLLLLLTAALCVGALAVLDRFFPADRHRLNAAESALALDPKAVDHIEVSFEDGRHLALAQKDGFWRVAEPFDDIADPTLVAQLINALASLEIIDEVDRDEFDEDGWKMTGLSGPAARIRVLAGGTTLGEYGIGAAGSLDRSAYVMLPPANPGANPQAFLVRTDLLGPLKTPPQDWREMKLLHLPADAITAVTLARSDGQIELSRQSQRPEWTLTKPIHTRASKERVSELLAVLLNLEITTATVPALPAAVVQPPATPPDPDQLKITIAASGLANPWEITIKKPAAGETVTTAQCSYRKFHFTVTSPALASLWTEPNAIRDDHVAQVDADDLTEIHIKTTAFPDVDLKKENDAWLLKRGDAWTAANGDRVQRAFSALGQSKVREFTSDSAADLMPFGLDTPFLTLAWTAARKGEQPRKSTLQFGQSADSTAFFVKYADEPFIYRIHANLLPDLPPDPLKWRGLGVMRFSLFALRKLIITQGAKPATELDYDPTASTWKLKVAGEDLTARLDPAKAESLVQFLSRFNAQTWSSASDDAVKVLQSPETQIQILLGEPGQNTAPTRSALLSFAPTQPGTVSALYYGRLNESGDVFYITKEAMGRILDGVLAEKEPGTPASERPTR